MSLKLRVQLLAVLLCSPLCGSSLFADRQWPRARPSISALRRRKAENLLPGEAQRKPPMRKARASKPAISARWPPGKQQVRLFRCQPRRRLTEGGSPVESMRALLERGAYWRSAALRSPAGPTAGARKAACRSKRLPTESAEEFFGALAGECSFFDRHIRRNTEFGAAARASVRAGGLAVRGVDVVWPAP